MLLNFLLIHSPLFYFCLPWHLLPGQALRSAEGDSLYRQQPPQERGAEVTHKDQRA